MASILIVEDDDKIARTIKRYLQIEGHIVESVLTGEDAVEAIRAQSPELVVLDLMLPGIDGIAVCDTVRPAFRGVILMLTASENESDELMALNSGVDDFVCKPVRLPVLVARINAHLRRVERGAAPIQIQAGALLLNRSQRTVRRSGEEILLSETEFEVIWTLALNRSEVVTRDKLFESVLGRSYDGMDRSIDMQIAGIRKKLGDSENPPKYIRSLRARGYLLL
ncbi:MAG: DNA-binding response OmpR family regulator [Glaciecola sp.]|jgi:DNA-binding response OmpR family regulator|uniref:response regulator transcription factor n=1 Tax=Congregibacter sp. TaxID=2744308 RepID=UPI0039E318A7